MLRNRFIIIAFCVLLIPLVFIVAFNGKEEAAEQPEEVAAPAEMAPKVGTQKQRAEALGKKYAGTTITMIAEGISTGPHVAYAPEFEKATGIKVNVVAVPYETVVPY